MMNKQTEIETKLDQVIGTLQQMNILASYDNISKLMGCLQVLSGIREDMRHLKLTEENQNADNGNE